MGCAHGRCRLPRGDGGGRREGGGVPGSRAVVPGAGLALEYTTLTVDGLYPDSPGRESQDVYLVATRSAGDPDLHLFAVFDGHGAWSRFSWDGLPRLLLLAAEDDASRGSLLASDPAGAFRAAMVGVNEEMRAAAAVDNSVSGTTAVAALVAGGALHVANVGDLRAVTGSGASASSSPRRCRGTRRRSTPTSVRVSRPAARGSCPSSRWRACATPTPRAGSPTRGTPPRVWARDGLYPSTAFTRSLGNREVKTVEITPAHLFVVVASDGVFGVPLQPGNFVLLLQGV